MPAPVRVLFVCLGNICRSPIAEAVFRARVRAAGLAAQVIVDSAGTGAWHVGKPPDSRAIRMGHARGFDLAGLRARQVAPADLATFDFVLAMDRSNRDALLSMAAPAHRDRIALLLDHAPHTGLREVSDPYYGDDSDFAQVLDLVEAAADGLLLAVRERLAC